MIARAFSRFNDLLQFGRVAIVPAARMLFSNRRRNFSLGFVYNGIEFTASFSFLDPADLDAGSFRVGEIFVNQKKSNSSELEALARDSMILASFALQHGASLESLIGAMTKDQNGGFTSVAGHTLGEVALLANHVAAIARAGDAA